MAVRIEVRDGEPFAVTLQRFQWAVQLMHDRPCAKPKRGYYEKPSTIRRKRRLMRGSGTRKLWISLHKLHRREGPFAQCE
jgi:ribosomal protein S21